MVLSKLLPKGLTGGKVRRRKKHDITGPGQSRRSDRRFWGDHLSDLVIANIHYDVIIELIKGDGFLKKKWFIFSGLMRSQAENIRLALSEYPTEIVQEWNHEMAWHTFLGKVQGSSNE